MTVAVAEDRERIGPYRLIKAIGAGGSARIDLARIERAYNFQRHVVIKRPLEHLRGNTAVAASLQREARIGGRLRHPNLVAILDAGTHEGYDYLVLEYIHGASLRTLMQTEEAGRVRDVALPVALAIVIDIARGMHAAHELTSEAGAPLGLVHRDVSPGNVLLGLDGTVKLADFGIAKETRVSTLSGSIHGTVTYMAPEQCQGHAFDRRADVFSLGVILYELCTGTRLFWADNDVASLHKVLSGTVPRPRKVKPQLAVALEDAILAAVAHDPGKRTPTARELAIQLETFAASSGEIVGARAIQRTMEEVVGPKQVPWVAATTVPDIARRGEGSLIDIIAATPDDEPPSPIFGEAAGAVDDLIEDDLTVATEAPAPPPVSRTDVVAPRRTRRLLAGIVIGGLAIGSAATAIVMLQRQGASTPGASGDQSTPTGASNPGASNPGASNPASTNSASNPASNTGSSDAASTSGAPTGASTGASNTASNPDSSNTASNPDSSNGGSNPAASNTASTTGSPSSGPSRPSTTGKRNNNKNRKKHNAAATTAAKLPATTTTTTIEAAPPPPPPPPPPPAGTGSANPPHTVEWNEHQLFPNEGSGARKSP